MNPLEVENLRENSQTTSNFGKMKITKENFDKLKQLDRIEFRQKHEIITKDEGWCITLLMYLSGFMTIVIIGMLNIILTINYHEGKNAAIEFARDISPISSFVFFGFTVIVLLGFIEWVIKKYKLTKLEQEYFTEEIKVKK